MSVRLFAGASGFSYKPWKGPFYPEGLPDAEMLGYYAARLPAVEINNTFYRLPKAKMLEDWAGQTPEGFRFVLKASRRITHMQRLKDVSELLGYLFETAGALGPKLGPLLFQLPPHLKKDLDRLRTFLGMVPADRRVALEFRNASWFEDDVYEALRAHDAALCVAETEPDDKESGGQPAPLVATASWGYLRLRRENYSDADLETWAGRMRGQGWSEAYVFFKHEDEGTAPKLALRLMQVMGAQPAPAGRSLGLSDLFDDGKEPDDTARRLVPAEPDLDKLKEAAVGCTACPLHERATQTVFGEGRAGARVMLIGEQPGDQEDLQGRPFVGPAGQLLDWALEKAGIDRTQAYVSNVVKHFKWVPRGKRRIHSKAVLDGDEGVPAVARGGARGGAARDHRPARRHRGAGSARADLPGHP